MQGVLDKAYNGFLGAIEDFANCAAGPITPAKQVEVVNPVAASTPDYAYPCDNYINTVLDNRLVRQTLRTIATKYYGGQLESIIQSASELTSQNYPNLYANYQHCCNTLIVANPPKVYITPCLSGINALSVEEDDTAVILLSYLSVIVLNDKEQRFLLGHELGHTQLGHMVVHTVQGLLQDLNTRAELLGPIVTDLIDAPLNRWYRTSEFTADRAGYLCCRDIELIERLFVRLGMIETPNAYHQYKEIGEDHPMLNTRFAHLQEYAKKLEIK